MTTYIIKAILCSALFMFTYKVLLEGERMHRFNRFYLLSSLLLSFIIPVITFNSYTSILPTVENLILNTNILPDSGSIQRLSPVDTTSYTFLTLVIIYVTITTLFFFRCISNIKRIFYKTRNNSIIPYKKSKIILINENLPPHSFLNYIFINKEDYKNGSIEDEIIVHELSHVEQKHSYDILFVEIMQTIFWFNPFVFLYRKSIQLNHEFLADESVINTYQNTTSYQYLLIDKANKQSSYALTSQFNYLITKKRLIMITKTKSFRNSLCRQISLIPVLALSIFLFSTKTFAQDTIAVPKTKHKEAPSTQEGVSQELLNEYEQIVNKTKNEKGFPVFSKFSDAEKSRLEVIFLSMNKVQQAQQNIVFMPAPPPFSRVVPTKEQIESWKNSKIYGLWIDDKRVSNSELNKYENIDFAHVGVSRLEKNAINYGKHYYQVNLMTTEHYDTYYKKAIEAKKKYHMGVLIRK